MRCAFLFLLLLNFGVSCISLQCETCSGLDCFNTNQTKIECSNNFPKLPFYVQITPLLTGGQYEYGCMDLEYYTGKTLYRIKQCYPVSKDECICKKLRDIVKLKRCSFVGEKNKTRKIRKDACLNGTSEDESRGNETMGQFDIRGDITTSVFKNIPHNENITAEGGKTSKGNNSSEPIYLVNNLGFTDINDLESLQNKNNPNLKTTSLESETTKVFGIDISLYNGKDISTNYLDNSNSFITNKNDAWSTEAKNTNIFVDGTTRSELSKYFTTDYSGRWDNKEDKKLEKRFTEVASLVGSTFTQTSKDVGADYTQPSENTEYSKLKISSTKARTYTRDNREAAMMLPSNDNPLTENDYSTKKIVVPAEINEGAATEMHSTDVLSIIGSTFTQASNDVGADYTQPSENTENSKLIISSTKARTYKAYTTGNTDAAMILPSNGIPFTENDYSTKEVVVAEINKGAATKMHSTEVASIIGSALSQANNDVGAYYTQPSENTEYSKLKISSTNASTIGNTDDAMILPSNGNPLTKNYYSTKGHVVVAEINEEAATDMHTTDEDSIIRSKFTQTSNDDVGTDHTQPSENTEYSKLKINSAQASTYKAYTTGNTGDAMILPSNGNYFTKNDYSTKEVVESNEEAATEMHTTEVASLVGSTFTQARNDIDADNTQPSENTEYSKFKISSTRTKTYKAYTTGNTDDAMILPSNDNSFTKNDYSTKEVVEINEEAGTEMHTTEVASIIGSTFTEASNAIGADNTQPSENTEYSKLKISPTKTNTYTTGNTDAAMILPSNDIPFTESDYPTKKILVLDEINEGAAIEMHTTKQVSPKDNLLLESTKDYPSDYATNLGDTLDINLKSDSFETTISNTFTTERTYLNVSTKYDDFSGDTESEATEVQTTKFSPKENSFTEKSKYFPTDYTISSDITVETKLGADSSVKTTNQILSTGETIFTVTAVLLSNESAPTKYDDYSTDTAAEKTKSEINSSEIITTKLCPTEKINADSATVLSSNNNFLEDDIGYVQGIESIAKTNKAALNEVRTTNYNFPDETTDNSKFRTAIYEITSIKVFATREAKSDSDALTLLVSNDNYSTDYDDSLGDAITVTENDEKALTDVRNSKQLSSQSQQTLFTVNNAETIDAGLTELHSTKLLSLENAAITEAGKYFTGGQETSLEITDDTKLEKSSSNTMTTKIFTTVEVNANISTELLSNNNFSLKRDNDSELTEVYTTKPFSSENTEFTDESKYFTLGYTASLRNNEDTRTSETTTTQVYTTKKVDLDSPTVPVSNEKLDNFVENNNAAISKVDTNKQFSLNKTAFTEASRYFSADYNTSLKSTDNIKPDISSFKKTSTVLPISIDESDNLTDLVSYDILSTDRYSLLGDSVVAAEINDAAITEVHRTVALSSEEILFPKSTKYFTSDYTVRLGRTENANVETSSFEATTEVFPSKIIDFDAVPVLVSNDHLSTYHGSSWYSVDAKTEDNNIMIFSPEKTSFPESSTFFTTENTKLETTELTAKIPSTMVADIGAAEEIGTKIFSSSGSSVVTITEENSTKTISLKDTLFPKSSNYFTTDHTDSLESTKLETSSFAMTFKLPSTTVADIDAATVLVSNDNFLTDFYGSSRGSEVVITEKNGTKIISLEETLSPDSSKYFTTDLTESSDNTKLQSSSIAMAAKIPFTMLADKGAATVLVPNGSLEDSVVAVSKENSNEILYSKETSISELNKYFTRDYTASSSENSENTKLETRSFETTDKVIFITENNSAAATVLISNNYLSKDNYGSSEDGSTERQQKFSSNKLSSLASTVLISKNNGSTKNDKRSGVTEIIEATEINTNNNRDLSNENKEAITYNYYTTNSSINEHFTTDVSDITLKVGKVETSFSESLSSQPISNSQLKISTVSESTEKLSTHSITSSENVDISEKTEMDSTTPANTKIRNNVTKQIDFYTPEASHTILSQTQLPSVQAGAVIINNESKNTTRDTYNISTSSAEKNHSSTLSIATHISSQIILSGNTDLSTNFNTTPSPVIEASTSKSSAAYPNIDFDHYSDYDQLNTSINVKPKLVYILIVTLLLSILSLRSYMV